MLCRIIVGLWICSALAAAPFFHFTKIHYWRFQVANKGLVNNNESPFSDPFHGNVAEQSAFCASLDTPEFLFEVFTIRKKKKIIRNTVTDP